MDAEPVRIGTVPAAAVGGAVGALVLATAAVNGARGPGIWIGLGLWALACAWTAYRILRTGRLNPHRLRLFLLLAVGTVLAVKFSAEPVVVDWNAHAQSSLGPVVQVCHIALAGTLGNLALSLGRALTSSEGMGWGFYYGLAVSYLLFTLLLGTGWCAWACGYGAWDEAASRVGARRPRWRLPGKSGAYVAFSGAVLITIVLLALSQREAVFCQWLCPFKLNEDLGGEAVAWVLRAKLIALSVVGAGLILVLPALTGRRTFCLLLCPFGAWQRWAARWHPFRMVCRADVCTGCGRCAKVCPFEAITVVPGAGITFSAACTRCGRCLDECPAGALDLGFGRRRTLAPRTVRLAFVGTATLLAGVVGAVVWARAGARLWRMWFGG